MKLPQELESLIKKSLNAVEEHPCHDLNLGYREAIWKSFRPIEGNPSASIVGHKRRFHLGSITIQHVLPLWFQTFPHDTIPETLLATANQVMIGDISAPDAEKKFEGSLVYMEELATVTKNMAIAVGYGALAVLGIALDDESYDSDSIDFSKTDSKEFDTNDSSFYASVAYANGPVWHVVSQPKPDNAKRKKFWEWWLNQAVPEAWNAVK